MQPQTLLSLLVGAAIGTGGILQGLQWKKVALASADDDLRSRISELEGEVGLLTRENESLRSLAQGGGELKVPPDFVDFIEKAFDLDFRSTPVVHRIAAEELRDRVTASIESRYPPNGLDDRQLAWALMGLLAPDDRFAPQLAAMRSLGARSWFDDQTGEAWVTDRFDESSVPDQSALIRVLGRILLHQHHPYPAGYPGDDAASAREALHHGAAMAVENRYLARQAVSLGFAGTTTDSGARDLLESLPVFVRGLSTFPSRLGTPRVELLMSRGGLPGALHEPPSTTAWFFPDGSEIEPSPPPFPEPAESTVMEESAGMLGLELWLEGIDPSLAPLAVGWRGDHYRLDARSDTALDLVWEIRMRDAEDADRLLDAALKHAATLAGADAPSAPAETLRHPDGRLLMAEKIAPDIVRFSNLSDD